ncbi:MAG: hypothetical protein AAFZ52_04460 [Bacteroidota bacterium]
MPKYSYLPFFLLLCLLSCDKDDATPQATVALRTDPTLGQILTDADGKTLYYFSLDHNGQSVFCVDACIAAWPVFHSPEIRPGAGLEASDFGVVNRADGSPQTTYKGWPLYYYAEDQTPGETKGEGVNDVWFVAKPDYTVMIVLAQLIGRDTANLETPLTTTYEPGQGQTFYFTDGEGNTLYRFFADGNNQNNYTAADFSNNNLWPLFGPELSAIPSVLNPTDFVRIDVHGRPQLTYKGWPLYTFQQDEERGDNYGVGFPFVGVWPIVNQATPTAP